MQSFKKISFTMMLVLVLALGSANAASVPEHSGRLEVTGNAVITAAPDTAQVILGVETANTSAERATTENAERMASVLNALESLGIDASAISTSGYNVYSYSDTYGTEKPAETTYYVHNRITITTDELDQVGKIVDVAVKAGANQVQSVTFDIVDKQEMQLQALEVAIKQALAKADVMSRSAGQTLGGIVSINEGYGTYVAQNESLKMMAVGYDGGASTSITPGEVEVTAQVTMVFWF